ncbi:MAG: SAM-dependent methyltransferase [Candidatus Nanoarchaeia archaeon]
MKVIIEHLDPKVWPWSVLEYRHISSIVGKENVIFTRVAKREFHKLLGFGEVHEERVKDLKFENVCILDPEAEEVLKPSDKKFDYFLFGGVLGNEPMDQRTDKELSSQLGYERRHLGKKQMSTDTAVNVVFKIIEVGIPFDKLKFVDDIEIEIEEGYSNIMPYRYLVGEDGKPVLPEGLIEYLKEEELLLEDQD